MSASMPPRDPSSRSLHGATSVLGAAWTEAARHRRSRTPMFVGVALLLVGGLATFGLQQSLRSNVNAQSGARFFLVSAPETVNVNEAFDITVEAQTAATIDTAYDGTVRFSSPEEPSFAIADYTFTTADLGRHTFALAGKFSSPGIKTIEVVDAVDSTSRGSVSVEVLDPLGSGGTIQGAPQLTSPVDGAIVNQTSVLLRGTATPGAAVAISDTDIPLGTATALADGSFTFDASNLAPGLHRFVATANGVASPPVNVTVQTQATGLTPDLILSRETVAVAPGAPAPSIEAQVLAEPSLRSVRISLDQRLVELTEDFTSPGTYRGTFLAPTAPGSYPVDVLVESVLGTPQPFQAVKTLVVTADATPIPGTNTPPTASFTFTPVSGPLPLTVTFTTTAFDAEDGEPVAYFWDFGDGATSTEKSPVHVFNGPGPYAPRLTVRDSGGLETTVIANPEITATGPAMILALLALSIGGAWMLQRRKVRA